MAEPRDIHSLALPVRSHEDERRRARREIMRRATDVSDARFLLDVLDLFPTTGETP